MPTATTPSAVPSIDPVPVPAPRWRSSVIVAGVALAVGLLLLALPWIAKWQSPDDVGEAFGRIVHKVMDVRTPLGEKREQSVPIAFLYCHQALDPPSLPASWLLEQRVALKEESTLTRPEDRDWRSRRCIPTFRDESTYAWLDASFELYLDPNFGNVLRRAVRNTPNATLRLQPRTLAVFVDWHGELYYRVVMASTALGHESSLPPIAGDGSGGGVEPRLRPVLISHNNLLATLEAWSQAVVKTIGKFPSWPCLCPAHFGILGSGLHFTMDQSVCPRVEESPNNWTVWLDFHATYATKAMGETTAYVRFLEGWHRFPALADRALWPRDPPDMAEIQKVPIALHWRGQDIQVLAQRTRILQLYPAATHEHWGSRYTTSGRQIFSTDDGYLLRFPESDFAPLTGRSCTPTSAYNVDFNGCAIYCTKLDDELLGMSPG